MSQNIPTSNNLLDVAKSAIEATTEILKTIVKGTPIFAVGVVSIRLYFKALNALIKGYTETIIRNLANIAKILAFKKMIAKLIATIHDTTSYVNDIIGQLKSPIHYLLGSIKASLLGKFINSLITGLSRVDIIDITFARLNTNLINKLVESIFTCTSSLNSILDILQRSKVYKKGAAKAEALGVFAKRIVDIFANSFTGFIKSFKVTMFSRIMIRMMDLAMDLTNKTNDMIDILRSPLQYWLGGKKVTLMMKFVHTVINAILGDFNTINEFWGTKEIFKGKSKTKDSLKNMLSVAVNIGLYIATLKIFGFMINVVDNIMDKLSTINKRRTKRSVKGIDRMQIVIGKVIEYLNSEQIRSIKLRKQLKLTLKLVALGSSILAILGIAMIVSAIGVIAIPAILGAVALCAIMFAISKVLMIMGKTAKLIDGQKTDIVLTAITSLIVAWTSTHVAEMLVGLGKNFGQIMIGVLIIALITTFLATTLIFISKISQKIEIKSTNLVINIITGFVTAWAAIKLSETIAPIAQNAKSIIIGMMIITLVTFMVIGTIQLLEAIKSKLVDKIDSIKLIADVITGFVTAWTAAKIAETVAPIAGKAKEVLVGTLVICTITLAFVGTLWLANRMLEHANLTKVTAGLIAMSLATLASFGILALAMIFAPFALISMIALVAIAGMAALIGAFSKYILKGALAIAALAIALALMSVPLLLIGITGAILAAACGSPKMVLVTMGAIVGFIALFAGATVLVGALMETGLFEIGLIGMALLGVVMIIISLPLLIIAKTFERLSKIDMSKNKNVFKDIIEAILAGVKVMLKPKNLLYLNPISLGIVMSNLMMLTGVVAAVGRMAETLQHIASLSIPTEFDKKGKPIAYAKMTPQDFVDAATNAGTIIAFFSAIFGEKKKKLPNGVVVGGILKNIEHVSRSHVRKMKRIRKMVKSVGMMAETLQKIASLQIPVEFDDKGKPTGYRVMNAGDFTNASMNVAEIVRTLVGVFDETTPGGKRIVEILDDMSRKTPKRLKQIMEAISPVSNIIDVITTMANGQYVKEWETKDGEQVPKTYGSFLELLNSNKTSDNISTMLNVVVKGIMGVSEDEVDTAEDIVDEDLVKVVTDASECISIITDLYNEKLANVNSEDLASKYGVAMGAIMELVKPIAGADVDIAKAEKFKQNVIEVDKLITKINSVNLDKLKTASNLMKHISDLSKSIRGDFRDLAKAINEDLLDALKKLVDVLENPPSRPAEQSTSIVAAAAPTNNKAQQMDPKKMNQAKEAQAREDIKELTKKIDKLAGVLQSAMTTSKGNTAVRVTEK